MPRRSRSLKVCKYRRERWLFFRNPILICGCVFHFAGLRETREREGGRDGKRRCGRTACSNARGGREEEGSRARRKHSGIQFVVYLNGVAYDWARLSAHDALTDLLFTCLTLSATLFCIFFYFRTPLDLEWGAVLIFSLEIFKKKYIYIICNNIYIYYCIIVFGKFRDCSSFGNFYEDKRIRREIYSKDLCLISIDRRSIRKCI